MSDTQQGPIYHMCRADEWVAAQAGGSYSGSSQDQADGFIHFSDGKQIIESAAKHRRGQDGLVILEVDPQILGPALKWETSRNDALFPHLYGDLPVGAVLRSFDLNLDADGMHVFPEDWGLG
jgi:uncharacterized protein (DUF952 family)